MEAAVQLTAHAVARFAERHAREVQVGSRLGVTKIGLAPSGRATMDESIFATAHHFLAQ